MATHKQYADGTYKQRQRRHAVRVVRQTIDFARRNVNSGSTIQVLRVEDGTWVLASWLRVIEAAPSNATGNLGYGSDTDYWGAALPLDTVGEVSMQSVEETSGQTTILRDYAPMGRTPHYFADADTIYLLITGHTEAVNCTSGRVEICALIAETS